MLNIVSILELHIFKHYIHFFITSMKNVSGLLLMQLHTATLVSDEKMLTFKCLFQFWKQSMVQNWCYTEDMQ